MIIQRPTVLAFAITSTSRILFCLTFWLCKRWISYERFEIFNIGTGRGSSVAEVVNCASEAIGKIIPMEVGPRRPGDPAEP